MSNLALSQLLFLLNVLGMMALMMTSKRHKDKFLHRLPLAFRGQRLRWLGFALLASTLLLTYSSYLTGYFVVVWFASLTVAAGLVYLIMVVYERLVHS